MKTLISSDNMSLFHIPHLKSVDIRQSFSDTILVSALLCKDIEVLFFITMNFLIIVITILLLLF